MQTKHLCVLIHIRIRATGEVSYVKPVIYFYWPFQGSTSFVDHLCNFYLVFVARLFNAALWSSAGKGLASWLSFVMFNCVLSLSHVVFWVRCGS